MAIEHDVLYEALKTPFGLVVTGSAKVLRKARSEVSDAALAGLTILGPDERGQIWIVRKDAVQAHMLSEIM